MIGGAAAGFAATVPMTAVMEALRAALPAEQHRQIPPREVVDHAIDVAAETTGHTADLDPADRTAITAIVHLGIGAAAGAVYAAIIGPRRSSALSGIAYGMAVWALAYGVGLPSLRLHPAATRDTKDRNELLIASHIVWGAVLGKLTAR